ncbi:MAG: hypothetical protein ACYC8T_33765 [Myxococcaceae bacterium]
MAFDTSAASTAELFATYRAILRELRGRTVVRTGNAPTGDYAEWLVAKHLGGELAPNSEKSFDVTGPNGRTYQVKSRMVDGAGNGKRQLSPFRSWEFDEAVLVLFDDDYTVMRASIVPRDTVRAGAVHREHVNGDVAFATDDLMDEGEDVTEAIRAIAGEADSATHLPVSITASPIEPSGSNAKFHTECANHVSRKLGLTLKRAKGSTFATDDGRTKVICFASKRYDQPSERYWFGFYSYQQEVLEAAETGYLAFGCGSAEMTFLVPAADFILWLDGFNSRPYSGGGLHWQVQIEKKGAGYELRRRSDFPWVSVSKYLLT